MNHDVSRRSRRQSQIKGILNLRTSAKPARWKAGLRDLKNISSKTDLFRKKIVYHKNDAQSYPTLKPVITSIFPPTFIRTLYRLLR